MFAPEALQVDVRRALENERDAPVASMVFYAFLLAHARPETLARDEAAELFCRALLVPANAPTAFVTRFSELYPPLAGVPLYRRARYALEVLEALYYREKSSAEAQLAEAEDELLRQLDGD